MNLIGKNKLSEFINVHPETELAVAAWLKQLQEQDDFGPGTSVSYKVNESPFDKFCINYHINRVQKSAYIIYCGFLHKVTPAHVTLPEDDGPLIKETYTISSGEGGTKTTIEREIVENDLRDEDYPIPKAETAMAREKIEIVNNRKLLNEADYKRAFYRAVMIFDTDVDSSEYEELQYLLSLITEYENETFKFKDISLQETVLLHMEECKYTTEMLAQDLREETELVEDFLAGKGPLSKKTMKKLVKRFRLSGY